MREFWYGHLITAGLALAVLLSAPAQANACADGLP